LEEKEREIDMLMAATVFSLTKQNTVRKPWLRLCWSPNKYEHVWSTKTHWVFVKIAMQCVHFSVSC
jgi:hypothetical protein